MMKFNPLPTSEFSCFSPVDQIVLEPSILCFCPYNVNSTCPPIFFFFFLSRSSQWLSDEDCIRKAAWKWPYWISDLHRKSVLQLGCYNWEILVSSSSSTSVRNCRWAWDNWALFVTLTMRFAGDALVLNSQKLKKKKVIRCRATKQQLVIAVIQKYIVPLNN